MPGGSVGRDQLAMAAKVRRHWFNPCRLGSRGRLGANFSLLLYTDLIKKRKPSRDITDEGKLIRDYPTVSCGDIITESDGDDSGLWCTCTYENNYKASLSVALT